MKNTTQANQSTLSVQQRWPHPSVGLSVSQVAALLGVARTTLTKPINSIREDIQALAANPSHVNRPIPTRKPEVATVAKIFAYSGEDGTSLVKAQLLIEALNIDASRVEENPPPPAPKSNEVRYRLSKKKISYLNRMPPGKLLDAYEDALSQLGEKDRKNTRRLVHAIIQALVRRNIVVTSSKLKIIEGRPYKDFRVFATLAGWAADANADDYRLFAFIKDKGRPLDFPLLPRGARASAKLVLMNVDEWLAAMRRGFHSDRAKEVRIVIDKDTEGPKKPSKGPLRT